MRQVLRHEASVSSLEGAMSVHALSSGRSGCNKGLRGLLAPSFFHQYLVDVLFQPRGFGIRWFQAFVQAYLHHFDAKQQPFLNLSLLTTAK
jgi:hypothetical protein